MHFCQIQHKFRCSEYLCKLGKEYLNALTCKFYSFTRQNSATFDVSHAFLPLTVAKLSTPNNSPFFGPPVLDRVHMVATWWICLNDCCLAAMWLFLPLQQQLVIVGSDTLSSCQSDDAGWMTLTCKASRSMVDCSSSHT